MEYIKKMDRMRIDKGLSFRELGLECELSESTVKKILYKKCAPRVQSLEKICTVLGASLPEIFCEADEVVLKKTDEIVTLIAVYNSLPAEAKNHLFNFAKSLCEK